MAEYHRTNWVDGSTPAINATNLNNIESGIENAFSEINDTSISLLKAKANIEGISNAVEIMSESVTRYSNISFRCTLRNVPKGTVLIVDSPADLVFSVRIGDFSDEIVQSLSMRRWICPDRCDKVSVYIRTEDRQALSDDILNQTYCRLLNMNYRYFKDDLILFDKTNVALEELSSANGRFVNYSASGHERFDKGFIFDTLEIPVGEEITISFGAATARFIVYTSDIYPAANVSFTSSYNVKTNTETPAPSEGLNRFTGFENSCTFSKQERFVYVWFYYVSRLETSADTLAVQNLLDSLKITANSKTTNLPASVVNDINELKEGTRFGTMNKAYSWWVNNRVVDSYGNLYFGFINRQTVRAGVGIRYVDGRTMTKDLWFSDVADDHNAPSVVLLTKNGAEYVCVIGSTGHNTDQVIHVMTAEEPNTINCTFIDTSHSFTMNSDYRGGCSYANVFVHGSNVYDIFRCTQQLIEGSGNPVKYVWMCAKSMDYGETWTIHRLFCGSAQHYIHISDVVGNAAKKRIIICCNPQTPSPIYGGYVDLESNTITDYENTDIEKPMTLFTDGETVLNANVATETDFTVLVANEENRRRRLLSVFPTDESATAFLYATATDSTNVNFAYYRYIKNGQIENNLQIGESGKPFHRRSSYIGGAEFLDSPNEIIISQHYDTVTDGKHCLKKVTVNDSNTAVLSTTVLKKSAQCLVRPAMYDDGKIMYLTGKYNDTNNNIADDSQSDDPDKFIKWHFSIGFIE